MADVVECLANGLPNREQAVIAQDHNFGIAQVLHEFEECGDAMRYLDRNGRVGWKATARMVSRLAAAEHEARDEFEEWE